MYFVKSPWLLKQYYSKCIWNIPGLEDVMYLTFDDGPHPEATPFVLDELAKFNAKATFFCIGKNVEAHPEIYKRIQDEGHRVGNHTFDHLNGWKVSDEEYLSNVVKAEKFIESDLFRPPYGKITRFQLNVLTTPSKKRNKKFDVIMWDVLSGDFDLTITPDACTRNVVKHAGKGSIVVFHDSQKAFPKMKKALPESLKYFTEKGFLFEKLP